MDETPRYIDQLLVTLPTTRSNHGHVLAGELRVVHRHHPHGRWPDLVMVRRSWVEDGEEIERPGVAFKLEDALQLIQALEPLLRP